MQTTIAAAQTALKQLDLPCHTETPVAQLVGSMKRQAIVTTAARTPHGSSLDDETLADLRSALLEHGGARRLAPVLGVSAGSLERAAAGEHILNGTQSLIFLGLQKLQAVSSATSTSREGGARR